MKVTINVIAFNQLDYTRLCLESVLRHTPEPYELIMVDNGSTDRTFDYFRSVASGRKDALVIRNEENRIVEAVGNEVIRMVRGEILVGVTNDTVVSRGWLSGLIAALESAPDVAMAGPRASFCSGTQQANPGFYEDMDGFHAAAQKWAREREGETIEVRRLVGVLAASRRKALLEVGGYDEALPTNGPAGEYGFSDDDICTKLIGAGWRLLIANHVFIHHFGGVTVKRGRLDQITNHRRYKEKYAA